MSRSYIRPRECEFIELDEGVHWFNHFLDHGWTVVNQTTFNRSKYPHTQSIEIDHAKLMNQVRDWIVTFGQLSNYSDDVAPIDPNDEYWMSWEQDDIPGSNMDGNVMIEAGHTNFMWEARQRLKPIFTELWNPEDDKFLVTSFEGFTYSVRSNDESKTYFNLDHPEKINYPICIRGFLSLSESNNDDHGGFLIVNGSSKWFDFIEQQQPLDRRGSIPIKNLWDDNRELFKRVLLRSGDILLMDSRTIYTTFPPISAQHPFCTLNITMMLSSGLTPADIDQRIQWFNLRKQTGPWCYGSNAVLSSGTNTAPFSTSDRDSVHNVLYKNGQSASKTIFSDEDCMLVVGMTEDQIMKRYEYIINNTTISNGVLKSKSKRSSKPKRSNRGRSKSKVNG